MVIAQHKQTGNWNRWEVIPRAPTWTSKHMRGILTVGDPSDKRRHQKSVWNSSDYSFFPLTRPLSKLLLKIKTAKALEVEITRRCATDLCHGLVIDWNDVGYVVVAGYDFCQYWIGDGFDHLICRGWNRWCGRCCHWAAPKFPGYCKCCGYLPRNLDTNCRWHVQSLWFIRTNTLFENRRR